MSENYLTLKWGTLKSWDFKENKEAFKLLKQYYKIGASMSVMTQKDTPKQKEIICKLIDLMPGKIYLEWEDKFVSKEKAKKYIMEYRLKKDK
jgi:hypothetical protein